MTRKLLPLLLALVLALPPAVSAQDRGANSSRGSAAATPGQIQAEVFRTTLEEVLRRHRTTFSDSALWASALEGLVESLDDPYASVFTPDEVTAFDETNTGNYSGIGVQIQQLNDRVTITKVFRETPADLAGLIEGDVIVGVDGTDATEWTTAVASDSIRGPAGSDVDLMIDRSGISVPMPFTLTRAQVHVSSVEADVVEGTNIGYITVDQVTRGSAVEVDSVLRQLNGVDGLVLDLRRNPGGYLDESLMMSDLFLRPGTRLASIRSRAVGQANQYRDESFTAQNPARMATVPLVVLVDEYTASAAEIVTGSLQDHDRALVLGRRTFGKGVVQSVLDLPHGHKLRLTTGSWHTPLGRSLQRDRDEGGVPIEEDSTAFRTVRTVSGRELVDGGGIFPDLEVADDTLKAVERALLQASAEEEFPLAVRIAEFGFDEAQRARAAGQMEPELAPGTFEAFLARLAEDGVPAEQLADPDVRAYLEWRARDVMANRLFNLGAGVRVRMERDPVLARAIALLDGASTQAELYAAALAAGANEGLPPER